MARAWYYTTTFMKGGTFAMAMYKGIPVVSCNLIDNEGNKTLIEVGTVISNVEWNGAYGNPITSGTVIGISLRQKTGNQNGYVPAFDGIPSLATDIGDTCRADHDVAYNFVVNTLTIEDDRGRHVQVPVDRIVDITVAEEGDDETDDTVPPYGEVIAAPLHDTAEGGIPDEELIPDDYSATVTARMNDGSYKVEIIGNPVKHHTNGEGNVGAWVGVGLVAPAGATSVKYAIASTVRGLKQANLKELNALETLGEGKQGIAYYVDKCSKNAKLAIRVQWGTTGSDPDPIDYVLDLSGVTCM